MRSGAAVRGREEVGFSRKARATGRVALSVVTSLTVLAWTPAWAGRPLDTEDTGTAEPWKAQLELGGDLAKRPDGQSWSATGALSVGVLPSVEAQIRSALLVEEPMERQDAFASVTAISS